MVDSLVSLIDHAVLQPTHTDDDVRAACAMGAEIGVASICVKPSHVPLAVECLAPSAVVVSTVIGYPHGGTTTETKVAETHLACRQGAREVDMVVNLGKAWSLDWDDVRADVEAVVLAANEHEAITKVILETGLLPDDELKRRLCEICEQAQAAFVKTSTGFGYIKNAEGNLVATGATQHDVRLMREHCGPRMGVKASGGIRSYADARRFVQWGATRLGTSSTETIAAEERIAARQGEEVC